MSLPSLHPSASLKSRCGEWHGSNPHGQSALLCRTVQGKKLMPFLRGLNIVKCYFVPIQSPATKKKTQKNPNKTTHHSQESPKTTRCCKFHCSLVEQLQRWVSCRTSCQVMVRSCKTPLSVLLGLSGI